ncbi:MAG: hypothetical protein PHU25_21745 [Deltaproteobacteria bacterium]|nr:hypothetical protein [Deltaproteobacteria bacterium]
MRTLTACALLLFASCGTDPGDASGWGDDLGHGNSLLAPGPDRLALVAATDFSSGMYAAFDLDAPFGPFGETGPAHSDVVVRCLPGAPLVVGRLGADNLTLLDPASLAPVAQTSLGTGANPQDVAAIDDHTVAVSLLGAAHLAFVDVPSFKVASTLDLSAFADGDGLPEAGPMLASRGRLLVALELLDRRTPLWDPSGPGRVVVVDPIARVVTGSIALGSGNPATLVASPVDESVLVACSGKLGVPGDGGIERIDPEAGHSLGVLLSGADLGGDPMTMDADPGSAAVFLTIYTESGGTAVKRVRLDEDPPRVETLIESADYRFLDAAADDQGRLWVADRDPEHPGLRVFDADTGRELTDGPLDTGLPPFDVCFEQ